MLSKLRKLLWVYSLAWTGFAVFYYGYTILILGVDTFAVDWLMNIPILLFLLLVYKK